VALAAKPAAVLSAPRKAVCTVCKEGEEDVNATVRYVGKEYYFCSVYCRDLFVKDPAAYIDGGETGQPGTHQHGPQGVSPEGGAGRGRSAAPT
jgi:YHS domain-containing protein